MFSDIILFVILTGHAQVTAIVKNRHTNTIHLLCKITLSTLYVLYGQNKILSECLNCMTGDRNLNINHSSVYSDGRNVFIASFTSSANTWITERKLEKVQCFFGCFFAMGSTQSLISRVKASLRERANTDQKN